MARRRLPTDMAHLGPPIVAAIAILSPDGDLVVVNLESTADGKVHVAALLAFVDGHTPNPEG